MVRVGSGGARLHAGPRTGSWHEVCNSTNRAMSRKSLLALGLHRSVGFCPVAWAMLLQELGHDAGRIVSTTRQGIVLCKSYTLTKQFVKSQMRLILLILKRYSSRP